MKTRILSSLFMLSALAGHAQLTIPGADGSDGALVITEDTTIDLSQAVNGDGTTVKWDTDNSANAGQGIYDPLKWAIVFKYSSVSVAADTTLTFTNHPSRAPVVWLVSGDVTVDGTVSVKGQNWVYPPDLAEPGPGGFRGGQGNYSPGANAGAGFGFTGGQSGNFGGGGAPVISNPSALPLVGASGGGGSTRGATRNYGGAAGGGALLIASSGTTTVNGTLTANGGVGAYNTSGSDNGSGGGGGGAIRVVTDTLAGDGIVESLGGGGVQADNGVIRVERIVNTNTLQVTPTPSVIPLTDGATALIWPPADAPTVQIISIGGENAPADPRATFGTTGADVTLPEVTTVQVVVETTGVEQASQVQVRLTPRNNAGFTTIDAVLDTIVSNDPLVIRWTADIPVNNGYSAVQAKVVRP